MSFARDALLAVRTLTEVLRAHARAIEETGPRIARLWIIAYLEGVADDERAAAIDTTPELLTWEQAIRRVVTMLRAELRH